MEETLFAKIIAKKIPARIEYEDDKYVVIHDIDPKAPVHVLVSGFTLHPIVGITDERPSFTLAAHEVEEVIEVSVEDLQDASSIRQGTRTREGLAIEYPYFDLMGHQVWGATAMILGEFVCLL